MGPKGGNVFLRASMELLRGAWSYSDVRRTTVLTGVTLGKVFLSKQKTCL
jgi:hypothetical protein